MSTQQVEGRQPSPDDPILPVFNGRLNLKPDFYLKGGAVESPLPPFFLILTIFGKDKEREKRQKYMEKV
jgi:hypothetical protein